MTKTTKRRFADEFKREAVALWETSDRTQTEIARELGIMPTMLRRWQRGIGFGSQRLVAQPPISIMASPADQASEIAKLRRELDRTRMERDMLKKVSASLWRCHDEVQLY
jgi:transposase